MTARRRPARRAPRLAVRGKPPAPRRRRVAVALGVAAVAAVVAVVAVAAAGSARDRVRTTVTPGGATDRTAFALVPAGRSHAEVAALLGAPRRVDVAPGAEAGTDCWRYASRTGRPIEYRLCFTRGLLSDKSIVPAPVGGARR